MAVEIRNGRTSGLGTKVYAAFRTIQDRSGYPEDRGDLSGKRRAGALRGWILQDLFRAGKGVWLISGLLSRGEFSGLLTGHKNLQCVSAGCPSQGSRRNPDRFF